MDLSQPYFLQFKSSMKQKAHQSDLRFLIKYKRDMPGRHILIRAGASDR